MPASRPAATALVALLLALALAACGGAQTPAAAPEPTAAPVVDPETRVKSFFADLSAALSDPAIKDEAVQQTWIAKLVGYTMPEQREQASAELSKVIGEFAGFDLGELTGQQGLDVHVAMSFNIDETRLAEEQGDSATVEIVGGTLAMSLAGADVAQLGEQAAAFSQEQDLSAFFGEDVSDRMIELTKVDGVWYMSDPLGGASE